MFSASTLITRIWALIVTIATFFTALLGLGENHKGSEELELVSTQKFVLIDAFAGASQGITNDGEFYYCSGSLAGIQLAALSKIDMTTGEMTEKKIDVIPQEFKDLKYDHIGDISYAVVNGTPYLYCALENLDDNADHLVVVFDTDLNYTGKYAYMRGYIIDESHGANKPVADRPDSGQFLCDGIPWCAADSKNGKLYCSRYKGADRLYVYDLSTLEFLYELPIKNTEPLSRIQGAEVFGDYLYLNIDHSVNENEKNKIIGKINLTTGEYETAFIRPISGLIEWESEGITLFEKDGDTYITISDYDHTVATYIHTYKIVKK